MIKHNKLTGWDYSLTILGAAVPFVGGQVLRKYLKNADEVLPAAKSEVGQAVPDIGCGINV